MYVSGQVLSMSMPVSVGSTARGVLQGWDLVSASQSYRDIRKSPALDPSRLEPKRPYLVSTPSAPLPRTPPHRETIYIRWCCIDRWSWQALSECDPNRSQGK